MLKRIDSTHGPTHADQQKDANEHIAIPCLSASNMLVQCSGKCIIQTSPKNIRYAVLVASFLVLLSIGNIYTMLNESTARLGTMGEHITIEYLQRSLSIEASQDYSDNQLSLQQDDDAFIIDVISVGSLTKPEYQQAQERTIGTHGTVRNFFPITELNDTDTTCSKNLSMPQLKAIKQFCKRRFENQSRESFLIRKLVYNPKNHTGWMCAQKRPIDGLYSVLQKYKSQTPPNYLFIIDDDSYINMDSIVHTLQTNHTENIPSILTGCPYNYPQEVHFVFPYGGFATFLSREALKRLMQPIFCKNYAAAEVEKSFTRSVCWQLEQNLMGESQFFQDGMSVGDLMYQYSLNLPFTKVNHWGNGTGFCFHSDHALGYFFGFYHVAVPEDQFHLESSNYASLRHRYGYTGLGSGSECRNIRRRCRPHSQICHYMQPKQMDRLFKEQQQNVMK